MILLFKASLMVYCAAAYQSDGFFPILTVEASTHIENQSTDSTL